MRDGSRKTERRNNKRSMRKIHREPEKVSTSRKDRGGAYVILAKFRARLGKRGLPILFYCTIILRNYWSTVVSRTTVVCI